MKRKLPDFPKSNPSSIASTRRTHPYNLRSLRKKNTPTQTEKDTPPSLKNTSKENNISYKKRKLTPPRVKLQKHNGNTNQSHGHRRKYSSTHILIPPKSH